MNALTDFLRFPARALWRRGARLFKKPVALIDEQHWDEATANYPFMLGLSAEQNRRLRYIASDFIARKRFIGAAGFEINERIKLEVAAQACILVLELDVDYYDGWREIILYPHQFVPQRVITDASGVVHTNRPVLSGEAWLGGPVVLSYEDVSQDRSIHGSNVVIHEFAHKLDMLTGEANGSPPLNRGMNREIWRQSFMEAYLRFCKEVDSRNAGQPHAALGIDPYAAQSPAEFFAVISEAFFELPETVMEFSPSVYAQLKMFYKQDPLARQEAAGIIERVD